MAARQGTPYCISVDRLTLEGGGAKQEIEWAKRDVKLNDRPLAFIRGRDEQGTYYALRSNPAVKVRL